MNASVSDMGKRDDIAWMCGTDWDPEKGPEFLSSTWIQVIDDLLCRNRSGWRLPGRIEPPEKPPLLHLRPGARHPDLIGRIDGVVVCSPRIADLFCDHDPSCLQEIPLMTRVGRRRPTAGPYRALNVTRVVDAWNLSCGVIRPGLRHSPTVKRWIPADEVNELEDLRVVLDPARVPARREFFVLSLVPVVCVRGGLLRKLRRMKPTGLRLMRVELLSEDPAARRECLADAKAAVRRRRKELREEEARRKRRSTVPAANRELRINLPNSVTEAYTRFNDIEPQLFELYALDRAVNETRDLRDSPAIDWPRDWFVISDDGRGGYFALDLSKSDGDDCPVVYVDHELSDIDPKTKKAIPRPERSAATFRRWLKTVEHGGDPTPKLRG